MCLSPTQRETFRQSMVDVLLLCFFAVVLTTLAFLKFFRSDNLIQPPQCPDYNQKNPSIFLPCVVFTILFISSVSNRHTPKTCNF